MVNGLQMWDPLNKWQFGAILSEKLIKFTAVVDSDNMTDLYCAMSSILGKRNQWHFPTINIDTGSSVFSDIHWRLSCDIFSIEEKTIRSLKIKKQGCSIRI